MGDYDSFYEEKHALLIGIDHYENIPQSLSNAVKDINGFKKLLLKKFSYKEENITCLIDKEADRNAINHRLYNFIDNTGRNDSLIIYFAGHGTTRLLNNKTYGFIVPYDGTEERLESLIDFDALVSTVNKIRAKHILLILDCCYGGIAIQRGSNGVSTRFLNDLVSRRAIQVLTSGKSNQPVTDGSTQSDHSLFAEKLLLALSGEAKTTHGVLNATSVINYVINTVGNAPNSFQTPSGGTIFGEGDFIFNLEELAQDNNSEISSNIPVERLDTSIVLPSDRVKLINEISKLLSDSSHFIALDRLVNEELLRYKDKTSTIDTFVTKDDFREYIQEFFDASSNILTILALLSYYYKPENCKLIVKIVTNIHTAIDTKGLSSYGDCFVIYAAYFILIICAIESGNLSILQSLLKLSFRQRHRNERISVLDAVVNVVIQHYDLYDVFYKDKNYRYPLSEYLFQSIQPILDDVLYMGESYEDKFITAELLIALFFATRNYKPDNTQVWAPSGRYRYIFGNNNINNTDADLHAKRIGLYSDIENIDDFKLKFNEFLSRGLYY